MEHSFIQLVDLPEEILVIIFKKLKNIEVLYSLIGVNRRFNRIVYDSIFTGRLILLKSLWKGSIFPLSRIVLNRFCSQILPEIHHKIQWLDLESLSMKRILFAADYPNLRGLGLYNIDHDTAIHFFTDEQILTRTFKNQISKIIITMPKNKVDLSAKNEIKAVCSHIFTVFPNLIYLNFYKSSDENIERLSFDPQLQMFSSTLIELHIKVQHFDDILYLLDGRFNKLSIFYVDVNKIARTRTSSPIINNKERLSNMKCFSMTSASETRFYDELIVPLLQQMINLEKLILNFATDRRKTFIDGNNLKENIINHMSQLNIFTFNIRSKISSYHQMHLLTNEDIQNTLTYLGDNCGLFKYVYQVTLFDEHPFEHEFFIRISQAFPFLKRLTVGNATPQNRKQDKNSNNNNNQDLSIIKYPHLTELHFIESHDDYIEQFLVNTKTCILNYIHSVIDYNSLQRVTHNFTREATRANCQKFSRLIFYGISDLPKHIEGYFPHAEMILF